MALATSWALLTCQINVPIFILMSFNRYMIIFTVRGDLWVMFCAGCRRTIGLLNVVRAKVLFIYARLNCF
jgi:hypothetical protein